MITAAVILKPWPTLHVSATESDCATVRGLVSSNALLTTQLATMTTTLTTTTRELNLLRVTTPVTTPGNPDCLFQGHASHYIRCFHNKYYCYTCGWDVPDWHKGCTCPQPKEGHKKEATCANSIGGSNQQKHLITG